jgi:aspartate kinase
MKVLKFGCKSLVNGSTLNNSIEIIKKESLNDKIFVVISARCRTIDKLKQILEKAANGEDYRQDLEHLMNYQVEPIPEHSFEKEYSEIKRILDGVSLLGEYTLRIKDRLLAYGEVMSCKTIVSILRRQGVKVRYVDARGLVKTDETYGGAKVLMDISRENVKEFFHNADNDTVEIITGAIASTLSNHTTTLGRNGANYSASLFANFLEVKEVQDWTTVDGIYSADPWIVPDAKIIRNLSFREANELANFGTEVLNAKAIIPLIEKGIPIRILNISKPEDAGTMINGGGESLGIKAVSAIENVVLIIVEGRGILGKIGIAGRLFTKLSKEGINVRMISLASSERGIGVIVDLEDADKAKSSLEEEFAHELEFLDISDIFMDKDVAVVSIIGRNLNFLDKAYASLPQNNIHPYLLVNTINGENVSVVISKRDLKKAVNVIHSQVSNVPKKLNVIVLGLGTVCKAFMDHIIESRNLLLERRNLIMNVFGVANDNKVLLDSGGIGVNWEERLKIEGTVDYTFYDIYKYVHDNNLVNVVIVDNTDSIDIVEHYPEFVERRYDIVAANKNANISDYSFYKNLRFLLKQNRKNFYYATNIGAGLPLINSLRTLLISGDKIKKIRGVFSGTLSHIFNNYSESDKVFTDILLEAVNLGYTEPDTREDLSGYDVGRKMVILAREIGLMVGIEDVEIENLIPDQLRGDMDKDKFLENKDIINEFFAKKKQVLKEGEVLRYIGEINENGELKASLSIIPKESDFGEIEGSDLIFEVYTELYGETPLIIRGSGAGAEVTAREVYSDLLRLAEII